MTGVICGVLAAALATSKDMTSKKLSKNIDGYTSAFASFLFALPFYAAILIASYFFGLEDFHILPIFWTYVGLRSFSDAFAETFKMLALSHGELSVVVSIISLHPLFMLITSPLITGDPLTLPVIFGLLLSVSGSLTITYKSTQDGTSPRAIVYGILCALFFSLNASFDRLSVQAASPTLSGFFMTLFACVFVLPGLLRYGDSKKLLSSRNGFLLRGVFEALFMIAKLSALTTLTAPELSAITRLSVLFSVIGGHVAFSEVHFTRKILGALLTIAGISIVLLSRQ